MFDIARSGSVKEMMVFYNSNPDIVNHLNKNGFYFVKLLNDNNKNVKKSQIN